MARSVQGRQVLGWCWGFLSWFLEYDERGRETQQAEHVSVAAFFCMVSDFCEAKVDIVKNSKRDGGDGTDDVPGKSDFFKNEKLIATGD